MTTLINAAGRPVLNLPSVAKAKAAPAGIPSVPPLAAPSAAGALPSAQLTAFASNGGPHAADALAQAAKQSRSERSGHALERLRQLVNQAKLMRQLMVGGDPKVTARLARDIAKQIADAAKDYAANAEPAAAASEASGVVSGAQADPAVAEATGTAQAATGDAAAAEAAVPKDREASAPAGGTEAADTPADEAGTEASVAADGRPPAGQADKDVTDRDAGAAAMDGKAAAVANTPPQPAAADTRADGKDAAKPDAVTLNAEKGTALYNRLGGADTGRARIIAKERELFQEVNLTLTALRSIAERARHRTEPHDGTAKDFEQAEAEVEKAEGTIGQHGEGQPDGIPGDAADDRSGTGGPSISVLA
ncbi:MAG: hypothetical protein HQL37_01205 [Alphaproteobacteria bacterium]|nr:hypothetical protein [Alphaproteobacteria bacterium]